MTHRPQSSETGGAGGGQMRVRGDVRVPVPLLVACCREKLQVSGRHGLIRISEIDAQRELQVNDSPGAS